MSDETPAEMTITVDPDALCELTRRARARQIPITDLASEIVGREARRFMYRSKEITR